MLADRLPENYSQYVGLALLYVAERLRAKEGNAARQKKMGLAIVEKRELLSEAYKLEIKEHRGNTPLKLIAAADWSEAGSRTLLVDAMFANPFAPYEIKYKEKDRNDILELLADTVGTKDASEAVENLEDAASDARKAHRRFYQEPLVWAAFTVAGTVLMGGIGFLAAPAIAGMIGASSGLAGAAATAHGLAVLGGGSLAAGGAGMAGGMAVVTAAGAGVGTATGGGAALLMSMTPDQARFELIKLQTTFAYVLLPYDRADAKKAVTQMKDNLRSINADLNYTKQRNEDSARAVETAEKRVRGVEKALEWMVEKEKKTR